MPCQVKRRLRDECRLVFAPADCPRHPQNLYHQAVS